MARKRVPPPYRYFKARWQLRGGHVDVDMFVANHPSLTFQNMGKLVMSEEDFKVFRKSSPNFNFEKREDQSDAVSR
jgi:hypothetical protein